MNHNLGRHTNTYKHTHTHIYTLLRGAIKLRRVISLNSIWQQRFLVDTWTRDYRPSPRKNHNLNRLKTIDIGNPLVHRPEMDGVVAKRNPLAARTETKHSKLPPDTCFVGQMNPGHQMAPTTSLSKFSLLKQHRDKRDVLEIQNCPTPKTTTNLIRKPNCHCSQCWWMAICFCK